MHALTYRVASQARTVGRDLERECGKDGKGESGRDGRRESGRDGKTGRSRHIVPAVNARVDATSPPMHGACG